MHLGSTHYFWEKDILWGETVSTQMRQTMEKDMRGQPAVILSWLLGDPVTEPGVPKIQGLCISAFFVGLVPMIWCSAFTVEHLHQSTTSETKTNQQTATKLLGKFRRKLSTIQNQTNQPTNQVVTSDLNNSFKGFKFTIFSLDLWEEYTFIRARTRKRYKLCLGAHKPGTAEGNMADTHAM